MTIPPIHNSIVQWRNKAAIFLNIFVTPRPGFLDILNPNRDLELFKETYKDYMEQVYKENPFIYIPTTATTIEEVRQLHPELLI